MHHGAWLYVYFYIKGVAIHRSPYSDTRTSLIRVVIPHHAWLYIKCVVIHMYLYSSISLCHIRLYTWLFITVRRYTYIFTLKASVYTVLRTPALTLHHVVTRMVIPLHVWLSIKHMVIHIYLYSNIPLYHMRLYTWLCIMAYSYTRNFAYVTKPRHVHVCHRSIHSLSILTSSFMSRHRLSESCVINRVA